MTPEEIEIKKETVTNEFADGRCSIVEAITANAVLDMLSALVQMGKQFGIMP